MGHGEKTPLENSSRKDRDDVTVGRRETVAGNYDENEGRRTTTTDNFGGEYGPLSTFMEGKHDRGK